MAFIWDNRPRPRHTSLGPSTFPLSIRTIACVLLVSLGSGACRSWQPVELAPGPIPAERVRIRAGQTDWLELSNARVEGDSLLAGWAVGAARDVRLPLKQVTSAQVIRFDPPLTVMAVILTPIAIVAVFLFATKDMVYTFGPHP